MAKIAIFTAIFGDKDEIREPLKYVSGNGIDYFLITDNKKLTSSVYSIIIKESTYDDITKNARYYKVKGLEIFKEYDYVLWHDANIQIIDDKIKNFISEIKNKEALFIRHSERNCVFDEAIKCIELEKDYPFKILKQIFYYYKRGVKNNAGLYATGLFVLNMKIVNHEFLSLWWNEIKNKSRRDQLSLPYALSVYNIQSNVVEENIWNNEYSIFHSHRYKAYNFLSREKPKGYSKASKKTAIFLIRLLKKINR